MALVGCLFASYMLTAWDDVGETGREVRKQASGMRRWRGTSGNDAESATSKSRRGSGDSISSSGSSDSHFSSTHSAALDAGRVVLDSLVISPLTYAAKWPVAVAKSLTPSAVPTPAASRRASFAEQERDSSDAEEGSDGSGRPKPGRKTHGGRQSKPTRPQNMPPRPPLASLIPSMLLTLMIAVGAGLVGGWAKRRSGSASPAARAEEASSTPSSRMATPLASPRVSSPIVGVDPVSAAYVLSPVHQRQSEDPSMIGLGIGNSARAIVH